VGTGVEEIGGKKLEEKPSKLLAEADWASIGIQLVAHAVFRARGLAWRTADHAELADGLQPEDLAQEAIRKVLQGKRRWDPERGPLLPFLKGVVDSEVSHLAESKDNELQHRFPDGDDGDEWVDRAEFFAPGNDSAGILPAPIAPLPDAERIKREGFADQRLSTLFTAADGTKELQDVLDTIMTEGEWKPSGIAEHLGVPVPEVNNRLKRLRRLADRQQASPQSAEQAAGR